VQQHRLGRSRGPRGLLRGPGSRLLGAPRRARLEAPARFRWSGDCEVYLLQFSDDPEFPAGATRTAVRTDVQEVTASGTESYWRVVGGMSGSSSGAHTPVREVKRWR
jgi:hypothetical protein